MRRTEAGLVFGLQVFSPEPCINVALYSGWFHHGVVWRLKTPATTQFTSNDNRIALNVCVGGTYL